MNKLTPRTSTDRPWKLTTERLVLAGVFGGITIILGVVPYLGFIPIPTIANGATTEHIPVSLAGITGGPIVGIFSGLIFGLLSFLRGTPIFQDPAISILPRLFIGLVSWAVFASLSRFNRDVAAGLAGLLGSATNTILVLTMIVIRAHVQPAALYPIIPQAIAEAVVGLIMAVALTRVFYIIQGRYVHAPETKAREDLPY